MDRMHDERVKQVAIGAGILMTLALVTGGLLIGRNHMPGLIGEWFGMMIGVVTTPFFMEATFAIVGLVLVISLNIWRQRKDGDEFVYLEQVDGPDLPENLPDQAKWAVYRELPLDAPELGALERAEGELALGDHEEAAGLLAEMSREELARPDALRVRLELARATGKDELARHLGEELRKATNPAV